MSEQSKKQFWQSIYIPLVFVGIMWLVKVIEYLAGVSFAHLGLYPRTFHGLLGILTMPFIHGDFYHLINNSLPFLITGFAMLSGYPKVARKAFLWIYGLTGLWVWVAARQSFHIGASGLVFGMVSFLMFMGLFRREKRSISLALMVVFLYGGTFISGIIPSDPGISWEGHALGAVAGIFATVLYWKVDLEKPQIEDPEEEEVSHIPYWKYNVEGKLKEEYKHPPQKPDRPVQIRYIFRPKEKKEESSGSPQNEQ